MSDTDLIAASNPFHAPPLPPSTDAPTDATPTPLAFAGDDAPPTRLYYTPERYPPTADPQSPPINPWTDTHPLVGYTVTYTSDQSWLCGIVTKYLGAPGPTKHLSFDTPQDTPLSAAQVRSN